MKPSKQSVNNEILELLISFSEDSMRENELELACRREGREDRDAYATDRMWRREQLVRHAAKFARELIPSNPSLHSALADCVCRADAHADERCSMRVAEITGQNASRA